MLNKVQAFSMPKNAIYATTQKEVKSKEDVASVNNNGNVLNNNLNALASLGSSQVAIKFGTSLNEKMVSALNDYNEYRYNAAERSYLSIINKLDTPNYDISDSSKRSYSTNYLFKSYYMLGKIYKDQGKHAKAREAFEKSAENLKENISLNPIKGSEDKIDQGISRARIFLLQAYNEIDEIKKTAKEENISKDALDRLFGSCYDSDYLGIDDAFRIIRDALDE